jgi:DNA-binding NarL/FixJ family response regulator
MKIRARILVADDHEGMRERVHDLLGAHFEVVAVVSDGQAAVGGVQQDQEFVAAAFESGATAYVFKSRMHSDLVWAIDRALAGEVFVSPGAER